MNKQEIINQLNNISNENNLKIKITEKNINSTFKELGLDSLSLIDIVMKLEDKFKIILPDEELMKIETIDDLVNLIQANLK